MSIAAPTGFHTHYRHNIRIATKYPNITKNTFATKGILVEIIKLYGSIEIAPLVGLSDYIVDLVDTGETLCKNGLAEIEVIMHSSARLVANGSLSRTKHVRVKDMVRRLAE
jgi:ATP phosphoribosyltransferase